MTKGSLQLLQQQITPKILFQSSFWNSQEFSTFFQRLRSSSSPSPCTLSSSTAVSLINNHKPRYFHSNTTFYLRTNHKSSSSQRKSSPSTSNRNVKSQKFKRYSDTNPTKEKKQFFWNEGKGSELNETNSPPPHRRDTRKSSSPRRDASREVDHDKEIIEKIAKLHAQSQSHSQSRSHSYSSFDEPTQSPHAIIGKKKEMDTRTREQLNQLLDETMHGLDTLEKDKLFEELESQMRMLEEDIWNEFRSSGEPLNAFTLNHVHSVVGQSKDDIYDFYSKLSREEMSELLERMRSFERSNPIQKSPFNSFFKKIAGRDIASHEISEDELQRFFQIVHSKEHGAKLRRQLKKLLPDEVILSFGYDPELLKQKYGDEDDESNENDKEMNEDANKSANRHEDDDDHDENDLIFDRDEDDESQTLRYKNLEKDLEADLEEEELTFDQVKERMQMYATQIDPHIQRLSSQNTQNILSKRLDIEQDEKSLQDYIRDNNLNEELEKIKDKKITDTQHSQSLHSLHQHNSSHNNNSMKNKNHEQVNYENENEQYFQSLHEDLFNLDLGGYKMNDMEDYQVDNWKHLMKKQFEEDPQMKELFEKEFGTNTDEMIDSFAESMLKKKH